MRMSALVGGTQPSRTPSKECFVIIGIVFVCVAVAVLAFLLPRFSHRPQRGAQRSLGPAPVPRARRPARLVAC